MWSNVIQCDTMHLRTGLIFTWNIFYMFCVQWTAPWSGQGKQTDPSHGPDKPDNVQHTLRWFRKCTPTSTPFTTMFTEISVQYDKYLYFLLHYTLWHLLCTLVVRMRPSKCIEMSLGGAEGKPQIGRLPIRQQLPKANLKHWQLSNNYLVTPRHSLWPLVHVLPCLAC